MWSLRRRATLGRMALAVFALVLLFAAGPFTGSSQSLQSGGDPDAATVAAAAAPAELRLTASDDGREIKLGQGQALVIALDANPATGYGWDVTEGNDALLRRGTTWFEGPTGLLGAPGKQMVRLHPVGQGAVSLKLGYRRAWDASAPPARRFAVKVQTAGGAMPAGVTAPAPTTRQALAALGAGASSVQSTIVGATALPTTFSWCGQNGCTPIRDQGPCGSCWAFATAGVMESDILIKDGVSRDSSEQYLVSCNGVGWGCGGGWFAHDYHWNKYIAPETTAGVVDESAFPYTATDATCSAAHAHNERLTSWSYVGASNSVPTVDAIKQAIATNGPVAAAVCAGANFQLYRSGVLQTADTCSGTVNHGIVLVGWDDTLGAWRLRNSWGTSWGESGYMWIKYGLSNVGYAANYAVYGAQPIPAAPTGLTVKTTGATQLSIGWTDASTNEAGFKVERLSGTTWTQIGTTGSNVATYTDSGLTCNTAYSYRVRAYSSGGDSVYSNTLVATTAACPVPTATLIPTATRTATPTRTPAPTATPAPPANDTTAGAKSVSGAAYTDTMSTVNATSAASDPSLTCSQVNSAKGYATVWYQVRPTANGTLTVDTAGSTYGNTVAVWQNAKNKLTSVGCNSSGTTSTVTVPVQRNGTYYIEVAANAPGGGSLKLNVKSAP